MVVTSFDVTMDYVRHRCLFYLPLVVYNILHVLLILEKEKLRNVPIFLKHAHAALGSLFLAAPEKTVMPPFMKLNFKDDI